MKDILLAITFSLVGVAMIGFGVAYTFRVRQRGPQPKLDWLGSALASAISLALAVQWWDKAGFISKNLGGNDRWSIALPAILLGLGLGLLSQKISGIRWRDGIFYGGYRPKDERETFLVLRATNAAYVTLNILLPISLLTIIVWPTTSPLAVLFLVTAIFGLSQTVRSYFLAHHGYGP